MAFSPVEIPNVRPSSGFFGLGLVPKQRLSAPGVIRYNGALYSFFALGALYQPASCPLTVWKSVDGGLTWARLDALNEPVGDLTTVGCFDQANTVIFAVVSYGSSSLVNFNLASETWGGVYGAGGPDPGQVMGLFRRSNGDLVYIGWDSGAMPVSPLWAAYVFSGGTWSSGFNLGADIAALPGFAAGPVPDSIPYMPAVMRPDDALGIFMYWAEFGPPAPANPYRMFYIEFTAANTTRNFYDFPSQYAQPDSILTMGSAVIAGDAIVAAVARYIGDGLGPVADFPTVLVGTPLAAPVWTLLDAPGIDVASYGATSAGTIPMVASDGTTLYCLFIQTTDLTLLYGQNQLRLCQTKAATPLTGWSAQTLFDFTVDPAPAGFNFPGQTLQIPTLNLGSVLPAVTAYSVPGTPPTVSSVYFLAGPPPPAGFRIVLRGVKRREKLEKQATK